MTATCCRWGKVSLALARLNLLTYKTCQFLRLYRPPLGLLANIALIEKRPAQSEFSANSGSNMLQVVKSESGFGQRQQSSPNRQQQKRKGDNFGDEDPTERVFMDSLRLRLLALVKSVGQKRCDGSNTTKTSAGSA